MGLVSMGLQLENPVKGPFSWAQICHGSTLPAEEYLFCSSLKFLAASCHHPPLQGASAYCSADSEKFLHLTLLFLIYIQVSVLIENVSWWLVTAQHTPGERSLPSAPNLAGSLHREVTEPCQDSHPGTNGSLILLVVLQNACWEQFTEVLNNVELLQPAHSCGISRYWSSRKKKATQTHNNC